MLTVPVTRNISLSIYEDLYILLRAWIKLTVFIEVKK